ncbi:hypothetical protein PoB_000823400 [Plakobranchus ocellatus]|uniref:Uncharacterized protein n=1 Tax=Plakobranchus ocellatus TaxID=259542 RepID=A0AAV3YI89_9GAST|nr:hypothetical protein PoB_000823400 [Plakobranchus ocellatus]
MRQDRVTPVQKTHLTPREREALHLLTEIFIAACVSSHVTETEGDREDPMVQFAADHKRYNFLVPCGSSPQGLGHRPDVAKEKIDTRRG